MKVLVVSSHPDRSEAHIYTALHRQGVGVEVMCDPDVRLEGANSEGGLATSHVRFRSRLDFGAMRFVRERVKSAAFDVVYMVQKRCCTNVMASLVGIDVPIVSYRGVMGNISRWNPETRLTYFSRKMKRIICVSEAVRQSLLALGIPADKAVTVYKGHAASWYQPGDRNCLEEFGVPSDAFAVGCAARLRKRKGIDVLLRAAAKLRETNIHFLLVGNVVDKYITDTWKNLHLEERVHLAGERADAPKLMGACDCFVMPSRKEGLPRAVIEAMAQGVPPILADVGGMHEMIEHMISGILVPGGNAGALADAIKLVATDRSLRDRMGDAAKTRMMSLFDIERTVTSYREIFAAVASQRDHQ